MNCLDCHGQVEDWLNTSFCVACLRRHSALAAARRAHQLVVDLDDVAATLAAGLIDRLSVPRG